jgi:hypothetical protein
MRCSECGHENPADSRFCRSCGSALSAPPSEPPPTRPAEPPTAVQQPPAQWAPPNAPTPAPATISSGATTAVLVVIAVLVLAAVAGGAILLSSGGSSKNHRAAFGPSAASSHTTQPPGEATEHQPESSSGTEPNGSTEANGSGGSTEPSATAAGDPYSEVSTITNVLREFHQDVLDNNLNSAWELTSERYRKQKEEEPGGFETWASNQRSLQHHLDPSGLRVSIYHWEATPQIATIRVTGMRWHASKSPCTHFQGITWMHRENGSWYYEPGYSISSQRRSRWEAHKPALLGWGCA